MDRECKHCGSAEWTEIVIRDDADHRTVYECNGCGREGRSFEHSQTTIYSGALR